jgi:hypothetical protein
MSIKLGPGKRQVAPERGAGIFRMHVLVRLDVFVMLHVVVRLSTRRDSCRLRIPGLLSGRSSAASTSPQQSWAGIPCPSPRWLPSAGPGIYAHADNDAVGGNVPLHRQGDAWRAGTAESCAWLIGPWIRPGHRFSSSHPRIGASAPRRPGGSNHTTGQAGTRPSCAHQRRRALGRHAARSTVCSVLPAPIRGLAARSMGANRRAVLHGLGRCVAWLARRHHWARRLHRHGSDQSVDGLEAFSGTLGSSADVAKLCNMGVYPAREGMAQARP